jgi:hypothetical protein
MKYILLDLVYFGGIIHFLYSCAKGVGGSGKSDYYLICTEKLVRDLCFVIHSFSIEEVGCQACE